MRSFVLSVFLVIGLAAPTSAQVTGTVTGTALDAESGEPLASVQLSIVGSGLGSLSGPDGRYQIANVPGGSQTLRAERIGYATMNVAITVTSGAAVVQDFGMSLQALAMDEIVVTGVPGGTRMRAIGNSVDRLSAADISRVTPVTTVQQVLRGRSPGVNMSSNGIVGTGTRIRIRGASQLSNNQSMSPLIYIDGIRANNDEHMGLGSVVKRNIMASIDPEQIERIEVLKGPAAATLYGTEASRGVINIITKRGNEGPVRVEMMVRQGMNYLSNGVRDKLQHDNYWTDPADGQRYGRNACPSADCPALNMLDYMDELGRDIFTTGQVQAYSGSISGGSQDSQYFFAGTYTRENGVQSHNYANNLNVRTNFDTQLSENVGITLRMGYTNSRDRLIRDGYASRVEAIEFGSPRYLPDNRCRTTPSAGCAYHIGFSQTQHPTRDEAEFNNTELDRFTGGVTFNIDAFGWLTTRLTTGIDYTGEQNFRFRDFQTNDTTAFMLGTNGAKGYRNEDRVSSFLSTTDFSSTADLNLTENITSSTSMGVQYYTRSRSQLGARGDRFAGPGLSTITATEIKRTPRNSFVSNNTLGSYVQEVLGYKDRLFFTAALRIDNNSAFGSDIDFLTYPKFSLSWVASEEPWFDSAPSWINTLRLRGAWGQSGEQPNSFASLRTWAPVEAPGGAGVTPQTLGNPDLTAEVGEETELGMDLDLFGRVGLEFTAYHKLTKGAILSRDLPPSGGFQGQRQVNAGRIRNEGFEAGINANIVDGSAWRLDLGFNLSYNRSEILQLSGEPGDTTIVFNAFNSMEQRVGAPPWSWFGVDVISGDFAADGSGDVINALCSDGAGGTLPCFDAAGTTIAPRVFLGRAIPPWEANFTTDIGIGDNLSLHAMFTSEMGHKRFDNQVRQRNRLYTVSREANFPAEWETNDLWELKATIQGNERITDGWTNDVGFIRLKEVSLSYELPQNFRLGVDRAVLQIAARNMLTWSDWTSADPEVVYQGDTYRPFFGQDNQPIPQQITASIRVNF